ncbi:MAG: hypothetical protein KF747_03485 [Nitrospira sp.]|nr:hypothetical protein [Nitrospira sp.]
MPKGKGTKPRAVARRFRPSFLSDLDGRYPVVRGLKYRYGCYLSDLGGLANLSTMEQTIVKRIVHLEHLVEQKESALIAGTGTDINEYLSSINCLSGLLSKIGLKRRSKQISLRDYLTTKPEPVAAPLPAPMEPSNKKET